MEELDLVKEQWAASRRRSEILRLALGCLAAVLVALLIRWERAGTATPTADTRGAGPALNAVV